MSSDIIEICGKKYRTKKAHIMIVTTQLVDAETDIPLKSVNITQKEELLKQGFDFIGFGPVGYWGKLEI